MRVRPTRRPLLCLGTPPRSRCRAQASQLLLERGVLLERAAQNLRDAMYEQGLHNEAINLASNVTKLRAWKNPLLRGGGNYAYICA
jgi:hypothetical protein